MLSSIGLLTHSSKLHGEDWMAYVKLEINSIEKKYIWVRFMPSDYGRLWKWKWNIFAVSPNEENLPFLIKFSNPLPNPQWEIDLLEEDKNMSFVLCILGKQGSRWDFIFLSVRKW